MLWVACGGGFVSGGPEGPPYGEDFAVRLGAGADFSRDAEPVDRVCSGEAPALGCYW